MIIEKFIAALNQEFEANRNPRRAVQQEAYLKNKFECFGLSATDRRQLTKPFLSREHLPSREEAFEIVMVLWKKPEREFQYFALDLMARYVKKLELEDIRLFEELITHKSWWDSVDLLASQMVGCYFRKYPEERERYIDLWLDSGNIWLQRSTLLFQLKYKEDLNRELMMHCIESLLGSKEFFINKAIGWILRQHGRLYPEWVVEYAGKTDLHPLSKREALKNIKFP